MAVLFDFLVRALFILFQVMEIGLIVYVFITWIPFFPGLRQNVSLLMAPLLQPIQKLLRKSVIPVSYTHLMQDLFPGQPARTVSYMTKFIIWS